MTKEYQKDSNFTQCVSCFIQTPIHKSHDAQNFDHWRSKVLNKCCIECPSSFAPPSVLHVVRRPNGWPVGHLGSISPLHSHNKKHHYLFVVIVQQSFREEIKKKTTNICLIWGNFQKTRSNITFVYHRKVLVRWPLTKKTHTAGDWFTSWLTFRIQNNNNDDDLSNNNDHNKVGTQNWPRFM